MVVLGAAQAIRSQALARSKSSRAAGVRLTSPRRSASSTCSAPGCTATTSRPPAIFDESDCRCSAWSPTPTTTPGPAPATSPTRRARRRSTRSARPAAWRTCAGPGPARRRLIQGGRPGRQGSDPREVVIGLSPGVGRTVWQTLSGSRSSTCCGELLGWPGGGGLRGAGRPGQRTLDLGMVGLTAARWPGRGSASACRARAPR